jgi:hypothetical protein
MGTLDEVLGHRRRYTEATLRQLARDAGFEIQEVFPFNRIGTPAWWLNGKLLGRRHFGLAQIAILNLLTPIFRRVDRFLPFAPLSLIAVARPSPEATGAAPRAQIAGDL